MSLLATSYRYEVGNPNTKSMQKALACQQARIKEDDNYATRQKTVDTEKMIDEISKWSEALEEASDRRKARREKSELKEELRLGNKSSILTRRAQLQELLIKERAQYREELEKIGLTFHQERL